MDNRTFKLSFVNLLEKDISGLASEQKVRYMRKWIKEYEHKLVENKKVTIDTIPIDPSKKIGVLVRSTIKKVINDQLLSPEKIILLQDEKYCKYTFDINYSFLKKIDWSKSLSDQRKVNGYGRYWAEEIRINNDTYFICNDWYDRNKPKFIKWVNELV